MNNKSRSIILAIQIAFVVLTAVFISYHIIDKLRNDRDFGFDSSFSELADWTWVKADGTEVQVTLPLKLDLTKGETATIYTTLPQDIKDDFYFAYYNSRDSYVFVGDELRLLYDDD